MNLPDPETMKALMTDMSSRVQGIIDRLTQMAVTYGVHGKPMFPGGCSIGFWLTRISERWSVYVSGPEVLGVWVDLSGAKLDMKLQFLEHAAAFEKEYADRIAQMYDKLVRLK